MTQTERIEKALRKGPLTRLDAINRFGVLNLWARIAELRQRGLRIKSERVTVRNRYGDRCTIARYRMG